MNESNPKTGTKLTADEIKALKATADASRVTNPISSTPKAVPATTLRPQPELPASLPQFKPQKHPLRFAVPGKIHLIPNLKSAINALPEIPDHYKALLHHELDNTIKTNAAQIDLHVVDHADGSVDSNLFSDMADDTNKQTELVKKFKALKTHEEKCEFLHQPENYPILGQVYNPVHFPKPAVKSEAQ